MSDEKLLPEYDDVLPPLSEGRKPYDYPLPWEAHTCDDCGRKGLTHCIECSMRTHDVVRFEDLKEGDVLTVTDVPVITGPSRPPKSIYSTQVDGGGSGGAGIRMFRKLVRVEPGFIAQEQVEVVSRDENQETVRLFVRRLKDDKNFIMTATKPGPWDRHPFATEASS